VIIANSWPSLFAVVASTCEPTNLAMCVTPFFTGRIDHDTRHLHRVAGHVDLECDALTKSGRWFLEPTGRERPQVVIDQVEVIHV